MVRSDLIQNGLFDLFQDLLFSWLDSFLSFEALLEHGVRILNNFKLHVIDVTWVVRFF